MEPHPHISQKRLQSLPKLPGVYLMKDAEGVVIYVGKAKVLRNRVRSYFNLSDSRQSVPFILKRVCAIETLVTENERQALVLESDLISKYRPKYNIRLKDDKSHYLVRVDMKHEWPQLKLVRGFADDDARYIGPFVFSHELHSLLDVVNRIFPLRTCSDRVIYNRVRPCLEHQIKRCAAPCCLDVDKEQYHAWLEQAISVLEGKNKEVLGELNRCMEQASDQLDFEEAANFRDRIEILKNVKRESPVVNISDGSQDAFALYREGSQLEATILKVRRGRLLESKTYGFEDVEVPDEEILSSVLTQYYSVASDLPDEILLPFELEDFNVREELYQEKAGKTVQIKQPLKGAKLRLLQLAESNARENYHGRFSIHEEANLELKELKELLSLEQIPRTMECADISHFQGGATVASIVFFKDGKPLKERYRRFTLSQEGKPDDFASMAEVVKRHLSRGAEENTLSDLLIIDGGKGQLSHAEKERKALGLERPELIAIAKKRRDNKHYRAYLPPGTEVRESRPERVYLIGAGEPVIPPAGGAALHLLERIRNEAHRFAITFHRSQRNKKIFRSDLDNIQGVGPKRRKDLLREFGSIAAIRGASPDELTKRCKIPAKLAGTIITTLKARAEKKEQS